MNTISFGSISGVCMREQRQESDNSELLEEFEVKVGINQGSVPSHFLFAVVVDVVTELITMFALCEMLFADDLALE